MGTIRLGKRTDNRSPLIKDFVPLADLDDLVFGAWDPFPDDAYEAARASAACSTDEHLEPIADFLKSIKPMPAVFDQYYVKRLDGTNVKTGQEQAGARRAAAAGHPRLQGRRTTATAWSWSGAPRPRSSSRPGPAHATLEAFEKAHGRQRPDDRAVDALRLRRAHGGRPVRQRRAQPHRRHPGAGRAGQRHAACRSAARTSRPARR